MYLNKLLSVYPDGLTMSTLVTTIYVYCNIMKRIMVVGKRRITKMHFSTLNNLKFDKLKLLIC